MKQDDAEYLIEVLKELLSKNIVIPESGKRTDYEAIDIHNNRNRFEIYIRRGNLNPDKCTYIILEKDTKTCLLRLDIVDDTSSHKNPDGQIIKGPHLHTYEEGFETSYAVEFNINNPNLVSYCIEFLKKINIIDIEKKNIVENLTLFN